MFYYLSLANKCSWGIC